MDFNRSEKVPKGRLLPFYLGEDGNVYPLRFRSMEEVESVQKIGGIWDHGGKDCDRYRKSYQ